MLEWFYLNLIQQTEVYAYHVILFSHKNEWSWVSRSEVDEPRASCTGWGTLEREKQVSYMNTYIWNLDNDTDEPSRTDLWTQSGKVKVGWIEKVELTYIDYHV